MNVSNWFRNLLVTELSDTQMKNLVNIVLPWTKDLEDIKGFVKELEQVVLASKNNDDVMDFLNKKKVSK